MRILERLSFFRASIISSKVLSSCCFLFCIFLCLIFLTDNVRLHRNVLYILVIGPFVFLGGIEFWRALVRSSVFLAALTYLLYLWLSLLWSSETAPYVFYNEARTLLIMLLFLAVTAFYASKVESFPLTLAKCFACIVGVASALSLVWFYSGKHIAMVGGLESRAVDIGLAAHPIDSAGLYGFAAVFLIFALFVQARCRSPWTWICGAALLTILSFIAMTQTRGAILGIVSVLALGLLFQGGRRLWLIMATLGAVTLGVILLSLHHPEGMVGFERRFSVRGEIWMSALERAWERPWFGFGLNEHQQLFLSSGEFHGVAHNLYLENLLFGGIIGTLLLGVLVVLALCRAFLEYRRSGSYFLPAILLYPLIFGITAGYLTLSKISPMWIQFWLPIGLIIGAEIRDRQNAANPPCRRSPAGASRRA